MIFKLELLHESWNKSKRKEEWGRDVHSSPLPPLYISSIFCYHSNLSAIPLAEMLGLHLELWLQSRGDKFISNQSHTL